MLSNQNGFRVSALSAHVKRERIITFLVAAYHSVVEIVRRFLLHFRRLAAMIYMNLRLRSRNDCYYMRPNGSACLRSFVDVWSGRVR